MPEISASVIQSFKHRLEQHPVYKAVRTVEDLRCFMEHHVYSVWDFMSLIKYLQNAVAPSRYPWVPQGDPAVRRFINELVLEEESDEAPAAAGAAPAYSSHFELYCHAMQEIGANHSNALNFVDALKASGIRQALADGNIPDPARRFIRTTFAFIDSDKPHAVAAALALGREHIIPCMFRSFLRNLGVSDSQAPAFHYYLNRHIHLDEDFHAPLSLRLLNSLCGGDSVKQQEAVSAAEQAVEARIAYWDGVLAAIGS
jgi:Protein of unknown function (DUF3050)